MCLLGQIFDQPLVLVTARHKSLVVGEVDHVGWANIHRVKEGAVGPTLSVRHRVALNVGLELQTILETSRVVAQILGLQLVVAVLWQERHPATSNNSSQLSCAKKKPINTYS